MQAEAGALLPKHLADVEYFKEEFNGNY